MKTSVNFESWINLNRLSNNPALEFASNQGNLSQLVNSLEFLLLSCHKVGKVSLLEKMLMSFQKKKNCGFIIRVQLFERRLTLILDYKLTKVFI